MLNKNTNLVRVGGGGGELEAVARRRNELMTAKFRLSLQAHRLFLYVLSQVRDDHNEETEYEFSVYELAKVIGIDRNHLYKSMVGVLDELAASMINVSVIEDGKTVNDKFVRIGLIKNRQAVRVEQDGQSVLAGSIAVSVYKELLPYVRALNERYSETTLKYVFRLTSSYSQKLYDLLKSRAFTGRAWRVSREELVALLAIEKGKFALWGDFRRYVLELAQREINTHTDLAFDIEYLSTGRTVTELVFRLRKEGGCEVEVLAGTRAHTVFKAMVELGVSAKDAERLLGEWWEVEPERICWHVEEAKRLKSIGKVRNAVAWLRAGLSEDYRPKRLLVSEMKKKAAVVRAEGESRDAGRVNDPELQKALQGLYSHVGGGDGHGSGNGTQPSSL